MQEIIRIVDKNIDKIPEQDYIDICNHLEEIYNNIEDTTLDSDYFDEGNKNMKMFVNLLNITVVVNMMVCILYSKFDHPK